MRFAIIDKETVATVVLSDHQIDENWIECSDDVQAGWLYSAESGFVAPLNLQSRTGLESPV